MTCDALETLWQAWLDAPLGPPPSANPAAESHRAHCPLCRSRGAGYLALASALDHLPTTIPDPSPDLANRVLALYNPPHRTRLSFRTWRTWTALAAAASLLLCTGLALWWGRTPAPNHPQIVQTQPPETPVPLPQALAEATSATLELALETSAPAARIGREVLSSTPSVEPPQTRLSDPSAVLQGTGRRLSSGVSPLSHQTQRAFSFLLGPAAPPRDGT